jgi:hypothetical protein
MKKWIFILALGTVMGNNANAQRIQVGPEIGINFNKFHEDGPGRSADYDMRTGLKIGGIVDIGFSRNVSFQPGLFYSSKGASYDYNDIYTQGGITYYEDGKTKIKANYLEIPMNIQFKFGYPRRARFFIGGGPYLAFAIGGEVETKYTRSYRAGGETIYFKDKDSYDLEIGDDPHYDDIKRSDLGLNLNAGVMMPRGFFLRANAGIGLANVSPDDNYDTKNLGFSLTAGFLFGR